MANDFEQLVKDVSYMRGTMDATFKSISDSSARISTLLETHEVRINRVETEQGKINTKVGIIGAIFGALGTFLVNLFLKK